MRGESQLRLLRISAHGRVLKKFYRVICLIMHFKGCFFMVSRIFNYFVNVVYGDFSQIPFSYVDITADTLISSLTISDFVILLVQVMGACFGIFMLIALCIYAIILFGGRIIDFLKSRSASKDRM